jgi:electron transport complex protein RnfB
MNKISVDQIDALLPQTQCQLCEFNGCRPYAEAIAHENAPLNRCLPGGIAVLQNLGELMQQDMTPHIKNFNTKAPTVVVIDEATCIGCTKCIDACPTDAILGSGKKMHTVITDACTGCELCIPPCPVNCIEILPAASITPEKSIRWRIRHERKKERLLRIKKESEHKHQTQLKPDLADRKKAIEEALARVQKKKN